MQIAASLTFTTLLSLVPLITIMLTLLSAIPVFGDLTQTIREFALANLVPDKAGKAAILYMQQFSESAARLTTVGLCLLAITAVSVMITIEQAFNTIWKVTRPRPLLKRLVIYWAALTLGPLLMGASLSFTSWVVGLSMGYFKYIPNFGFEVLRILPVLFTTVAFTLLFRLVPNRYVPSRHALIGALVAAGAFEIMNRVFGYYITHFTTYKLVYGTFSSFPIFLMWIYLSWLSILLGAVITASLLHWGGVEEEQPLIVGKFLHAMRVLQLMSASLKRGRVTTLLDMSRELCLGYDMLEEIIEKLVTGGMVSKAEQQGWLLKRDIGQIRAAELINLFVMDRSMLLASSGDDTVKLWLASRARQLENDTDITLQELFAMEPA